MFCRIYSEFIVVRKKTLTLTRCSSMSYVFSSQKEERSVLLSIGCLEFITEPESPLFLKLQPAHCLPQRATICTDDTQSRTYEEPDRRERDENATCSTFRHIKYGFRHHAKVCTAVSLNKKMSFHILSLSVFGSAFVPLRKEKFLRNPGVTKESAKQRRRPLNSSPVVLMLTEWGLELTKHTVTCRRKWVCDLKIILILICCLHLHLHSVRG